MIIPASGIPSHYECRVRTSVISAMDWLLRYRDKAKWDVVTFQAKVDQDLFKDLTNQGSSATI